MTQKPALREVGGYTILRELGRGGAGTVYLARQEALDRQVALKVLHRDMAKDEVYLQRFFREARSAAIFQHPNVVAVHDAGEDAASGDYYIAFEFVDGGSLEDLLQDGKLVEERALEITLAVAQALVFATSKNLIHRDVKPANILLAKDGAVKLADLGLAKRTDPEAPKVTVEGLIVGTPYYMAPEQALGRVDIDHRVDVYSLGLCLWCMLTGRTPYLETREENSTVIHVLSRRLTEELPDVRQVEGDIHPATAQLIADMTARKRERRYRSAADVVRDIERIQAGQAPLGPEGVERRLSDMPTTSVDAARLHEVISAAAPEVLEETMAALRPQLGTDSTEDEEDEDEHVGPRARPTPAADDEDDVHVGPRARARREATDDAHVGPRASPTPPAEESQARRGLLAQSSEELQTLSQRPLLLAILLGVLAVGLGVGAVITLYAQRELVATGPAPASPSPRTSRPDLPPLETESPGPSQPATSSPPAASPATSRAASPPPAASPTPAASPATSPAASPTPAASPAPHPHQEDGTEDHLPDDSTQTDDAALLTPERVTRISADMFRDTARGLRSLERLVAGERWQGDRASRRFVAVLTAARELLDRQQPWSTRERGLKRLDEALRDWRQDPQPLDGPLAAAVTAELEAWAGFAKGIRALRQGIGDPRLRPQALAALEAIPADRGITASADLLLGLVDRIDLHQRWLTLDNVREDLLAHRREVLARLDPNALGYALREEILVVGAVLDRLLLDPQSCLVAALSHPSVQALPPSVFLSARLQAVPETASLSNMPGYGLRLDLEHPPSGDQTVRVQAGEHQVYLGSDVVKIGPKSQAIDWRGATRVYVARRREQLLLRVVGAEPPDLTLAFAQPDEPGPTRFTVRPGEGMQLRLVALVQIPDAQRIFGPADRGGAIRHAQGR